MSNPNESQNVSIAVMATDIKYIKEAVAKLDSRLQLMDGHFVKREEMDSFKEDADKIFDSHNESIRELELTIENLSTTIKIWGTIAGIIIGIIEPIVVAVILAWLL